MAQRYSIFKYKPPVAMYESKGLFSKLLFSDTPAIARYIHCVFNDEDPNICPQTEEIYNISTLLLILSTGTNSH